MIAPLNFGLITLNNFLHSFSTVQTPIQVLRTYRSLNYAIIALNFYYC